MDAKVPGWHLHRRMYDWVLSWADTSHGLAALVLLSFAESSFFPIPPDVLLIALVLGCSQKWWKYALWCTVASVVGGLAGYGIGVFLWDTVGRWIVEHVAHIPVVIVNGKEDIALPGYLARFGSEYLFQIYEKWNAWIVFIFGFTPLPYKLVTITAGVARVNLPVFILASTVGRAVRFFAVALILRLWGGHAKRFIDRYFNLLCLLFVVLLIAGFAVLKFVL